MAFVSSNRRWLIYGLVAVQAIVFLVLGAMAQNDPTPISRSIALVFAAWIPYLLVLWRTSSVSLSLGAVLIRSFVLRATLVPFTPLFSDDIYRYIWDGRVMLAGLNPFLYAPASPELVTLRDQFWPLINHPEVRTIYPPMAQWLFALLAAVWAHPLMFKGAMVLMDLGVVWVIAQLAEGSSRGRSESSGARPALFKRPSGLAPMIYGLNPLVCVETAMSGHLESAGVLLLGLAILLALKRGPMGSGIVLALATAVKLVPVLMLPALFRGQKKLIAFFVIGLVALYLPFVSAGIKTVETLDTFGRRWEGNAGAFAVVKHGAKQAIGKATGTWEESARIHLPPLDPLARALHGTFFALHKDSEFDASAPASFPLGDLSLGIAKVICGLLFLGLMVFAYFKVRDLVGCALVVYGALVILTPVLHPWYALWVLPFAALKGAWPWFVFAAVLPLAYLPLDGWWQRGVWDAPSWIVWVEMGALGVSYLLYWAFGRKKRTSVVAGSLLK